MLTQRKRGLTHFAEVRPVKRYVRFMKFDLCVTFMCVHMLCAYSQRAYVHTPTTIVNNVQPAAAMRHHHD